MVIKTQSRREAILDAALRAFLDRGVADAPIEDICLRAGASVGSVYHHFGDKGGLAGAVYVEAHLRWCLRDRPDFARFLLFQGDAARGAAVEALDELNREFFAEVLRWWRPHARYGALRELDLDLVYALWLGTAQEYCRLRLAGRTAVAPDHARPALADAAWQSLRSIEGAS